MPRLPCLLAAAFLFTPPGLAADDFRDLLSRVQDSANAILLVDVQGLVKSPLDMKENWTRKHQSEFLSGSLMVPPTVDRAVLAAKLGSGEGWTVGVMPSQHTADIRRSMTQRFKLDL